MIRPEDVAAARRRLRGVALETPLIPCPGGDGSRSLFFKPESLQPTGAFKLRGAYNKISSLSNEERALGVVAHSSGNHARAVAYAARALGVKATIVMPREAAKGKLTPRRASCPEMVSWGQTAGSGREGEELAAETVRAVTIRRRGCSCGRVPWGPRSGGPADVRRSWSP